MRTLLLISVWISIAACGDRQDDQSAATSADELTPASTDTAFVALEGEGLRIFLAEGGSARPIAFGTPEADASAALTAVLGPPAESGDNPDCAASFATWSNGLTVWFSQNRFVGWHVRPDSRLTTVDGIGPGTTRSELETEHNAQIMPSSLGQEFTVGALAGLLESDAPDARVQHLWAGQTCIAR